jgi:cytochrome d ubiquinol oxidase subunit II
MSATDIVLVVLWIGVTAYALLGGADFGAGLWDLVAGGTERGMRPRELIDRAITPVWEANHTWLIFDLVVLWTAFSPAFAAVMSTLFVPLTLAALGIVLRGAGFAFRHVARRVEAQRIFGAAFALSSVLTPFFMGTVVGAIASGRVTPTTGSDQAWSSWTAPLPVLVGVLFVATCSYLSAVFLVHEAHRRDDAVLERYFRARAIVSGLVTGALAVAGLFVLRADARFIYDGIMGDALPLVIVSALCGLAALVLLVRSELRFVRGVAVLAVAAIVWGWGVAQHPYVLPKTLTVSQAAAPHDTMVALLVIFAAALVVIGPSLGLLFTLSQRSALEGEGLRD